MNVSRSADARAFLERAGDLLLADEARHNLALGLAATLVRTPEAYDEAGFWIVEQANEVVGAAMRTPPHSLVLAKPRQPSAHEALAEALDDEPPGVNAALPEAEDFARAWARSRGGTWTTRIRQRIHALGRVLPTAVAPGAIRRGGPKDRTLAVDWWRAFLHEAVGEGSPDEAHFETAVTYRLGAGDTDAGIVLWDDGGPVSLAGFGNPTPTGIRIGPVYTPPKLRGRGYATSLVAGLSTQLLAGGRRTCFLYTDLANPTANRLYARIGYRPVCDSAHISFEPK